MSMYTAQTQCFTLMSRSGDKNFFPMDFVGFELIDM